MLGWKWKNDESNWDMWIEETLNHGRNNIVSIITPMWYVGKEVQEPFFRRNDQGNINQCRLSECIRGMWVKGKG